MSKTLCGLVIGPELPFQPSDLGMDWVRLGSITIESDITPTQASHENHDPWIQFSQSVENFWPFARAPLHLHGWLGPSTNLSEQTDSYDRAVHPRRQHRHLGPLHRTKVVPVLGTKRGHR